MKHILLYQHGKFMLLDGVVVVVFFNNQAAKYLHKFKAFSWDDQVQPMPVQSSSFGLQSC